MVQGATAQHEHCKVIHPQQQPATPGHQPRELRSSILRRLHWRSVQSAGNLQSIILLIKLSVTKNKMPSAPGRACCQLIANCCVTEWDWDVNTSLRCIPYSHAGSVSCSHSGKLHFIMFVYSNIHFTNCHICLYYIRSAQATSPTITVLSANLCLASLAPLIFKDVLIRPDVEQQHFHSPYLHGIVVLQPYIMEKSDVST